MIKHNMYRHVQIHAADQQPRCSLDHTKHALVDAILKDLKNCARRLQAALKVQTDEAQILERVYYKGKNQHRGALFWRRVVEMRRFCNRIGDGHIDIIVDTFYRSFFEEKVAHGSKLSKGAWTHFPDVPFVDSVLARLSAFSGLFNKMHSRLMNAYQSFSLAMKSGTFLQLALTLAAVASRLEAVSSEIQDILEVLTTVLQNTLSVLTSPNVDHSMTANTIDEEMPPRSGLSSIMDLELSDPPPHAVYVDPSYTIKSNTSVPSQYSQRPSQIVIEYSAHQKVTEIVELERKKPKRKKLKTKDEIDDIFGF